MNAFLTTAELQIANPVKVKQRVAAARSRTAEDAERKLREQDQLLSGWRRWRRETNEALLAGPHGKDIKGLQTFLRTMTPSSAPALVRLVEKAAWLRAADRDTRFHVLSMIDHAIVRLRQRNGLPPFDDSLPGEDATAFEQVREVLR